VERLTPRTAIVTGASSGIGAAAARALAAKGMLVHVLGRREAPLRALANEIGGSHAVLDVRSADDVERVIEEGCAALGGVDVAVYAAGALEVSPVESHPVDLWDDILATNLRGAFLVARSLLPNMREGGRLAFISSAAGRKGQPNQAAYAASKAGLLRFAESLAAEVEPRGLYVHVVSPGPVATPMLDRPGTPGFQLEAEQVADVLAWLAELPPTVVVREIDVRAPIRGPFARDRHAPEPQRAG
jgi:NAD(P)-dependent dehydrogenase (short-subunit alcohol dehydrogenase family)